MSRGFPSIRWTVCFLVVCALILPMAAIEGQGERAASSWTFMVYLDADNNLETYGVDDFMEMASVGSTAQVNIVVQFDRGTHSDSDGGSSEYGNWASTKRFKVDQGETPSQANQISDLGEVNMGSAASLQGFLEWGMAAYPASRYALVFWDHGGGWIYGVCTDDTNAGDSLLMPEIRQAISAAENTTGKRVDLVGFDACLMGMVEVGYDLRALTDTVVFSEETEPGQGWAYDKVLSALTANPSMASLQLGEVIVDKYSEFYGSSGKETLSAVVTSSLPAVASALNSFASEMSSAYPAHSGQIDSVRGAVEHFEYEMIVDMYDLAQRVKNAGITAQLTSAAEQLMSSIQTAVAKEAHGVLRPGAHGLSLYYPSTRSDLSLVGYRAELLIAQGTAWDEFLETVYQGTSSDSYEPDDDYTHASQLALGVPQYHSILDGGADEDWARFSLPSESEVVIETSGVSGDTELYLLTEADVPNYYIAYDDDGGIDRFSRIAEVLPAGVYYLLVREYGQDQEIPSYQLTVMVPLQADAYEVDDDPSHASFIAPGTSQLHSIGGGGADVDWAYFTLTETQSVQIETWGPEGDTRVWLFEEYASELYELDSDDDTGVGLFSLLVEYDLAPGDYYIAVEEWYNDEEIPVYYLNLSIFSLDDAFEPDDDYLHATDLVPGEAQQHSIGDSGLDVDWFQFELLSGSDVHIETYGYEGDTLMYLFSSSGVPDTEVAMDDDSGAGYFSLLEVSDLEQGNYYVGIMAYQGYFGAEAIPAYVIVLYTDPSPPTGLSAQMSGSSVELEWSAPSSDGGLPIDHYEVLRGINGGALSTYRSVPGTRFLDSNVTASTTYDYAVRAVTEFGSGQPSGGVQVQIPGGGAGTPDAIGALSVGQAADRISLSWSAPDANGDAIIAYHVYRGTDAAGSDRAEIGQSATTSYVDSTVEEGRTYYYWVVAENGNGMGAMASATSATATDSAKPQDSTWLLVLVVVGAIAAVGVVAVMLTRRRKAPSRMTAGPPGEAPRHPSSQPPGTSCPNCGAPSEGMQFCGNCGRRLG